MFLFGPFFRGVASLDNTRFLCGCCAASPIFGQCPRPFFFFVSSHASPVKEGKIVEKKRRRGGVEKFAATRKKKGTLRSLTVRNDQEQKESLDDDNVYDD